MTDDQHDPGILNYRVRAIENTLVEMKNSQASIADSLAKLVLLEQRHEDTATALGRAFAAIKDMVEELKEQREKLITMESQVATMRESMRFHRSLLWSVVSVVLAAVFMLMFESATSPHHSAIPSEAVKEAQERGK